MKDKPGRTINEGSLCWECAHAVPSADGLFGCPWSVDGKRVKGWVADRRDLQKFSPGKRKSYFVHACPLYVEG